MAFDRDSHFALMLSLVDTLNTGIRACADLTTIRTRLSLMDGVAPLTFTPALDESGVYTDDAPVATLLMRCLLTGPEELDWALNSCRAVGLKPFEILCRMADTPHPHRPYPSPVSGFRPNPDDYRLVPIADLPPFHIPSGCDHKDGWVHEEAEAQSLQQPTPRWPWARQSDEPSTPTVASRSAADAWLELHHSRWCSKHEASIDWRAVQARAEQVHATIRPWTSASVLSAANPAGREPFSPSVALLVSMFMRPITWDGKSETVGDGQHRVCGARRAGLGEVLVARY